MLFNSVIFITIFLPLALVGWFLLQKWENPTPAKAFMVGMSLWFYGYYNIHYLWILLISLGFNYLLSDLFERLDEHSGRKGLLYAGILGNLGLLFYFKYFNFFIDNCNFFLHTDIQIERIALPLGISFFTFQQLSFVIERYRNTAPHYNVWDYAFFDNYIFYILFDSTGNTAYLHRMNQEEDMRILSPEVLGHSNDLLIISCTDNRVFVTGAEAMFYTCLAEIDTDGNIIRIIHEDKYW